MDLVCVRVSGFGVLVNGLAGTVVVNGSVWGYWNRADGGDRVADYGLRILGVERTQ